MQEKPNQHEVLQSEMVGDVAQHMATHHALCIQAHQPTLQARDRRTFFVAGHDQMQRLLVQHAAQHLSDSASVRGQVAVAMPLSERGAGGGGRRPPKSAAELSASASIRKPGTPSSSSSPSPMPASAATLLGAEPEELPSSSPSSDGAQHTVVGHSS